MTSYVKNIALVGASGLVGGQVLKNLLAAGKFEVTAISRQESKATFPSSIAVKKGDYSSSEFLESALQGQDVLILTLAIMTPPDVQTNFIKAAAKAGVPWVLPNEYGNDGASEEVMKNIPILVGKKKYRDLIEGLGVSNWIGIATNMWIDFGLKGGRFSIDIPKRTATVYDEGTHPFVTTSIPQVGRGIAKLLSLPITSTSGLSLSDYKNKYAYIRSFLVSQNDMIAASQRATKTKPEDWEIKHMPLDDYIKAGSELMRAGNRMGMFNILYGNSYKKGCGDQYHGRENTNENIGLEDEDLDEVVQKVVDELEGK
ncbi:NAD(P)-binding protein [Mollisia scopiformis]|uniref:NAD(P)-binding protein n=1 Tax=Mollisia scopiformis TaxID=149040 RepID=A0A194X299_MOLSC|nr:NAD(P)-binding protein [Mollisia scopiformis]KUJ14298.1 NAD(P)-binding protein [Mollisia scopiformis]